MVISFSITNCLFLVVSPPLNIWPVGKYFSNYFKLKIKVQNKDTDTDQESHSLYLIWENVFIVREWGGGQEKKKKKEKRIYLKRKDQVNGKS